MSEAIAPVCAGCGAPLPIDPRAPQIACGHCRRLHRVDEALRARLLGYVGGYERAVRQELEARWKAAHFQRERRAANAVIVGAVATAAAFAVWLLLMIAGAVSIVLLSICIVATIVASAVFGLGIRVLFGAPSRDELLRLASARCGRCGAYCAFAAGQAVSTCSHCGATGLIPTHLAEALLEHARQQAERAGRAERDALRAAVAASHRFIDPMIAAGVFFVAVVIPVAGLLEWRLLRSLFPLVPSWIGLLVVLAHALFETTRGIRAIQGVSRARAELEAELLRYAEQGLA